MNKFYGVGNLTKDPELRKTQSDVSVCTFTIACNRTRKNADGQRDADFLNIVVWRAAAENCHRFLKKGSKVAVSGSVQTRSYDDKDGNKRYVTEIIADDVEFINTGKGDAGVQGDPFMDMAPVSGDDLPF